MFKSLYSKLAVVLLVLFALVGLSLVAVTLFSAEINTALETSEVLSEESVCTATAY